LHCSDAGDFGAGSRQPEIYGDRSRREERVSPADFGRGKGWLRQDDSTLTNGAVLLCSVVFYRLPL
jgi:hypothetical protein